MIRVIHPRKATKGTKERETQGIKEKEIVVEKRNKFFIKK